MLLGRENTINVTHISVATTSAGTVDWVAVSFGSSRTTIASCSEVRTSRWGWVSSELVWVRMKTCSWQIPPAFWWLPASWWRRWTGRPPERGFAGRGWPRVRRRHRSGPHATVSCWAGRRDAPCLEALEQSMYSVTICMSAYAYKRFTYNVHVQLYTHSETTLQHFVSEFLIDARDQWISLLHN